MEVKRDKESKKTDFLAFWKDAWEKGLGGKKGRSLFLLFLLFLGIILMLASSFFAPQKDKVPADMAAFTAEKAKETFLQESYEKELARSLKETLERIDGISDVHVFIYFSTGGESVYAQNVEESLRQTSEMDREGGTREILEKNRREEYVFFREGGGEKALLVEGRKPEITGILVVARGAEKSLLRLRVVRAIQSALNLPAHRIAVLPWEVKGNSEK